MKINNIKPREKKRGSTKNQIPSFLIKLYQILEVNSPLKIRIKNTRRLYIGVILANFSSSSH